MLVEGSSFGAETGDAQRPEGVVCDGALRQRGLVLCLGIWEWDLGLGTKPLIGDKGFCFVVCRPRPRAGRRHHCAQCRIGEEWPGFEVGV